jgi:hypothetical protein
MPYPQTHSVETWYAAWFLGKEPTLVSELYRKKCADAQVGEPESTEGICKAAVDRAHSVYAMSLLDWKLVHQYFAEILTPVLAHLNSVLQEDLPDLLSNLREHRAGQTNDVRTLAVGNWLARAKEAIGDADVTLQQVAEGMRVANQLYRMKLDELGNGTVTGVGQTQHVFDWTKPLEAPVMKAVSQSLVEATQDGERNAQYQSVLLANLLAMRDSLKSNITLIRISSAAPYVDAPAPPEPRGVRVQTLGVAEARARKKRADRAAGRLFSWDDSILIDSRAASQYASSESASGEGIEAAREKVMERHPKFFTVFSNEELGSDGVHGGTAVRAASKVAQSELDDEQTIEQLKPARSWLSFNTSYGCLPSKRAGGRLQYACQPLTTETAASPFVGAPPLGTRVKRKAAARLQERQYLPAAMPAQNFSTSRKACEDVFFKDVFGGERDDVWPCAEIGKVED